MAQIETPAEEIPQGKRTVRRTLRGTAMGYIGKKAWSNLGDWFDPATADRIEDFLAGRD